MVPKNTLVGTLFGHISHKGMLWAYYEGPGKTDDYFVGTFAFTTFTLTTFTNWPMANSANFGDFKRSDWFPVCVFSKDKEYVAVENLGDGPLIYFVKNKAYRCTEIAKKSDKDAYMAVLQGEETVPVGLDIHGGENLFPHPWVLMFAPKADRDKYPHVCPKCGGPAYIGLHDIDCSNCGRS